VVNHGVGGYGPLQAVLKFQKRVANYLGARTAVLGITNENFPQHAELIPARVLPPHGRHVCVPLSLCLSGDTDSVAVEGVSRCAQGLSWQCSPIDPEWHISIREIPDRPRCLTVPSSQRSIRNVPLPRSWLGCLSVLLLILLGVGLISAALPDDTSPDSSASGYYDGDDDDAVVTPERMAVLVDIAVGARAVVLPEPLPDVFETVVEAATPPIVEQSPLPPLRSPPLV
jgi:hypothetical protein